ncbi:uncharacterized protein LOC110011061 [Jatropha curcas]|uniref:uncharacterized protein LOC110011061 n=1 Tax=Jatropha curcas TaxID=180498 RepID=UPI0009D6A0FF|nr:uncharacterized protein LOC110011061 [Jatropha curcas]
MLIWITYHSYTYPLVIPENPTIQNVKEEIRDEKYLKFAVEDQQLFCNRILLENGKRVEDYGITSDSLIFLRVIRRVQIDYNLMTFNVMNWDDERVLELKTRVARVTSIPLERLELLYNDKELQNDEKISTLTAGDTVFAVMKFGVQIYGLKRIYSLTVHKMMRVAELKQKLHSQYALDDTKLKLVLGDTSKTFLDDRASLDAYDIEKDGTVLHAIGGGA